MTGVQHGAKQRSNGGRPKGDKDKQHGMCVCSASAERRTEQFMVLWATIVAKSSSKKRPKSAQHDYSLGE